MPELPDIETYTEALRVRVIGRLLLKSYVFTPFLVRTVDPPLSSFDGSVVEKVERLGKRIVLGFQSDQFLVIHLMISGRLTWKNGLWSGKRPAGKIGLACFEFESGVLNLTEASKHKRASVYCCSGRESLKTLDPGGIEPLECDIGAFTEVLTAENRTLKRALTNPKAFSGIGNAYSDEILFNAKLSPVRLSQALSAEETRRLFDATRSTLIGGIESLRSHFAGKFPGPGEITAFRPEFAMHGKFEQPCPECGLPVQRIRYAENETNYCAKCQNEGRLLADRALSRLLKQDWPKTIEEMVGQ